MTRKGKKTINGKTKVKLGAMPALGEHEDLAIIQELFAFLKKDQNQTNQSFRQAQSHEETCRLQGRSRLVDDLLKQFSTNHQIKDDKDDDERQEQYNEYAC